MNIPQEKIEVTLISPKFYRPNRQYIVNENAIKIICSHSTGKLTVKLTNADGPLIDNSREPAHAIKQWLES